MIYSRISNEYCDIMGKKDFSNHYGFDSFMPSNKKKEKALEKYCNCEVDVLYCTHKINAFIFAFDMTWEGDDARCLHIEMSRRDHEIMPKF